MALYIFDCLLKGLKVLSLEYIPSTVGSFNLPSTMSLEIGVASLMAFIFVIILDIMPGAYP